MFFINYKNPLSWKRDDMELILLCVRLQLHSPIMHHSLKRKTRIFTVFQIVYNILPALTCDYLNVLKMKRALY